MQSRKFRILSAVMAGSLALGVAAITISSGLASASTDPSQLPDLGTCAPMNVGSQGPCVEALQYSLEAYGIKVGQDGQYGALTQRAVEAFQSEVGMTIDGIAGLQTIAALDRAANSPHSTPTRSFAGCPVLDPNASGTCVSRLQQELNAVGPYHLTYDGLFGQDTLTAVLDFQGRNHCPADGIVGPQNVADLLDIQAGPEQVCLAKGGSMLPDGTCGSDGAVGAGKSVWDCIQDMAGKDLKEALENMDQSAEKAGEVIPESAFKEFMKKVGAPAEAFNCVYNGGQGRPAGWA